MKTQNAGRLWLVAVGGLLGAGLVGTGLLGSGVQEAGAGPNAAAALGQAFTYQGRLKSAGAPLNATADFQFSLWDAAGTGSPPTGGTQIGATQAVNTVTVTGGLFTVQLNGGNEFGATAFTGDARRLQIAVRSPAGGGSYTTLSPRQPMTPVPYALYALTGPGGSGPWAVSGNNIFNTNAGNVGIGTTAPFGRLHVDSGSNLAITRTSGRSPIFAAGTGAANAELIMGYVTRADDYVAYSAVGDSFLFPSSNAGRTYLGRIPGNVALMTLDNPSGRVGIGTTTPQSKLDVRGDVKLGDSGQYQAVAASERLRIVRGLASAAGGLIYGSGCGASRVATGTYRITFSEPFTDWPTVTANAFPTPGQSHGPYVVMISDLSSTSVDLKVFWGSTATLYDCNVSFTAISSR